MKVSIDVLVPGRHGERHRIPEAGATVGSAANADVKIFGVPGIIGVHCSLTPAREGCWVELNETAPEPFTHQGKLSRGCQVAWGEDLFLGSVRLTLNADGLDQKRGKQSPVVWVAAVAVPLLALMAFFGPTQTQQVAAIDQEPPPLFGELPPCQETKAGAVGRGTVAEQVALAKHERGVFELMDSVESVQLMRESAVCYALGDNQGASDRAFDRAEAWIADLQFSYKRALLDLETGRRSLAGADVIDAVQRLQVLLSRSGPAADAFKQRLGRERLSAVAAIEEAQRKAAKKK